MFVSQIEPHHQNDHDRYEGPDGSSSQFKDFERPGDLPEGKGNWKEQYPNYLGCCHSLDYNIGRLVDTLKEKGLYENTIIIYTSDHGSHFRTRNQEYKRSCHDGCTHIPMVIHGPGFDTGTVVDSMVSLIDMPATLLDLAGISVPQDYSGHSVKQLVNSTPDDWQQEVFLQISESQIGRAIRTKQYKYSVRADGDAWTAKDADTYYEDFFYDLEKDPHEICNLVDNTEYATIRAQLAQRLMKRMTEAGEKLPRILPASHKPVPLQGNGFYYNHI